MRRVGSFVGGTVMLVAACVGDDPDAAPSGSSADGGTSSASSSSGGPPVGDAGGTSSSSSSSSSSGGDAGPHDAGEGGADVGPSCSAPRPATILVDTSPNCGAAAPGPKVNIEVVGDVIAYAGGTILPGTYELIRSETNNMEAPTATQGSLVFNAVGRYAHDYTDFEVPALNGANIHLFAQGAYSTSGNQLTFTTSCKSGMMPPTQTTSYHAYHAGCDDFLQMGTTTNRATYKRLREP